MHNCLKLLYEEFKIFYKGKHWNLLIYWQFIKKVPSYVQVKEMFRMYVFHIRLEVHSESR